MASLVENAQQLPLVIKTHTNTQKLRHKKKSRIHPNMKNAILNKQLTTALGF